MRPNFLNIPDRAPNMKSALKVPFGSPRPVSISTRPAMNARSVLFGAALQPWMKGVSPFLAYPSLFLLVDPNWATAMREQEEGRNDVAAVAKNPAYVVISRKRSAH